MGSKSKLSEIYRISQKHLHKAEYSYKRPHTAVIVGGMDVADKTRLAIKYEHRKPVEMHARYTFNKKINKEAKKVFTRISEELYDRGYIDVLQDNENHT